MVPLLVQYRRSAIFDWRKSRDPTTQTNGRGRLRAVGRRLKSQAIVLGGFIAVIWLVESGDWLVWKGALDGYGIRPRELAGLWGILFAPFLHGDFGHVAANTVPFVVLGWLVALRRISDFFLVSAAIMLIGGLAVWLIGPAHSVHIGASGLVFGYLGFLLLRGYFERSPVAILVAIVVGVVYAGVLPGLLPGQPGISWQGHLFGFAAGIIAARLLARRKSPGAPREGPAS